MNATPQRKAPPLLSVRPVFDQGVVCIEAAAAALAGAVAMTFLGATFFFIFFSMLGLGRYIETGTIYSTFFILGIALSPALYFEVKKSAWRRTVYNFYPDHLEYQDFKFLLQRRRGRIRLVDIRDVYERASPLQSRRMLTSVYLMIPSFSSQMQAGIPGIKISDVPESAELREKIIEIVENGIRRFYNPQAEDAAAAEVTSSAPAPETTAPAPEKAQGAT